ncbi:MULTISPECIES: YraN family protein [unclassified Adlercreutzia]|uniref:YraN family protein n=1 Tax=unclassified Adlercreutzia TaxID=2636013 RepID=UPI001F156709|nr:MULTISPECIES: YraN family protein [unclassified Adlercreutzia]
MARSSQAEYVELGPEERERDDAAAKKRGRSRGQRNRELGQRGEDAAARFLYRRGYDIVARNWTCSFGEADIIARDSNALVFVEVKTRSNCSKGFPAEAVSAGKRDKYEKIALAFLSRYETDVDLPVRFDVVSIVAVSPDRALVRHIISAFGTA